MKTINVSFEDSEIEKIERVKGKQSWRRFILDYVAREEVTALKVKSIEGIEGITKPFEKKKER